MTDISNVSAVFQRCCPAGGLAGFACLVTLSVGGAGFSTPAAAFDSNWEQGCAQRIVTPGPGDILRVMNCERQKDCQNQANAEGRTIYANGCFGVSPKAPYAPATRGPVRR